MRFGSAGGSLIDELLDKENLTLEELLNHEDVIQECKYMNARLVGSLSRKENIEKMIKYIITIPEDEIKRHENSLKQKQSSSNNNSNENNNGSTEESKQEEQKTSETSSATAESSENTANNAIPTSNSNESSSNTGNQSNNTSGTVATEQSNSSAAESYSAGAGNDSDDDSSSSVLADETLNQPNSKKYPYIASELIQCEVVSMLDVMFEEPSLLDLLFTFLDYPSPMDPSFASYFRKVLVVLIQRKYDSLVNYIRTHGIIDKLVNHIGLYSIMEILIMIGWDDGQSSSLGLSNDVEW
jgi:hypothetical protein